MIILHPKPFNAPLSSSAAVNHIGCQIHLPRHTVQVQSAGPQIQIWLESKWPWTWIAKCALSTETETCMWKVRVGHNSVAKLIPYPYTDFPIAWPQCVGILIHRST